MFVNQYQQRIRGRLKNVEANCTTLDLVVFDIKGSEVMVTWKRVDERSKEITQTHGGKVKQRDEMSPTQHECRQVPCSRATYCRHDNDCGSIFPHHFWRVPLYFYTSLKRIPYACNISPPFGRIHPSTFNEP